MKLLLTSSGITNETLKSSLKQLAGKPLEELSVVFILTAATAINEDKSWLIDNLTETKNCGFKYIDIVDISAVEPKNWKSRIEKADVIFMGGGNTFYLMWWLTKSGLEKELPQLLKEKIYVGISAGSLVLGPIVDIPSNELIYPGEENEFDVTKGAGIVDFCVLPHLNSEYFTNLREDLVKQVAEKMAVPTYALDDETAVKVTDANIEVVGEGTHLFIGS